jgi:two-component system sensor histidine kinase VicK
VDSVVESFQVFLHEKKIACTVDAPDFAVVAVVDKLLLEQALGNLVSNALKFTPSGGQISLRIKKAEEKIEIEVEDNGIGIPAAHISDLFKEFSKIRRKGLKGEKSTGLGLAIARQIIRLHNGSVSVKSQEGEGTTFTVELPLPGKAGSAEG